jgi:hypothetical protein
VEFTPSAAARNGVRSALVCATASSRIRWKECVNRYLEETGKRLELLTEGPDVDDLTAKLEEQEDDHWQEFTLGMERLTMYLAKNHPEEYRAIVADSYCEDATPHEFVAACLECYRANFDPVGLKAEIERLDAEHTALTHRYADLPTPRAKEKAKAELAQLEARIEALERQQEDTSEAVEQHNYDMVDLRQAIGRRQARAAQRGRRACPTPAG